MRDKRERNQSQNREITKKEQRNAVHFLTDYQSRRIERIQRLKKGSFDYSSFFKIPFGKSQYKLLTLYLEMNMMV
jgi:hypothetical protein